MGKVKLEEQLFKSVPMNANKLSDNAPDVTVFGKPICADELNSGSVQLRWTGNDTGDGTVQMQFSNVPVPGVNDWSDKTGAAATLDAAGGAVHTTGISLATNLTEKFYRAKWSKGTNSAGTLDAFFYGKG